MLCAVHTAVIGHCFASQKCCTTGTPYCVHAGARIHSATSLVSALHTLYVPGLYFKYPSTSCNLLLCASSASSKVGLWILWATWQLFDCYRKHQLPQHPMFAFTSQQHAAAAQQMAQPAPGPHAAPHNPFAYGGPGTYQPPMVPGYPTATVLPSPTQPFPQPYPGTGGAGRV